MTTGPDPGRDKPDFPAHGALDHGEEVRIWHGDEDGSIRARMQAVRREIDAAEFVPLESVDPDLDAHCRAAFVEVFGRKLRLDAEHRAQAGVLFQCLVADGWLRTVFEGDEYATGTWDGTEDALIYRAEVDAENLADRYKEDRNRYGDLRWG
jgi:hypothetical protein